MYRIAIFLALLVAPTVSQAMVKAQGDCMQGGKFITTNGMRSTQTVMQSFVNISGGQPVSGCTVSVYSAGTTIFANIFSDPNGTQPLGPVFTADATGHWGFYAANGSYDVVLSGAGISTPFTLQGVWVFDINLYTPPVQGAAAGDGAIQYNKSGAFAGDSNLLWSYSTSTLGVTGSISLGGPFTGSGQITSTSNSFKSLYSQLGGLAAAAIAAPSTGSVGGYIDMGPLNYNPYDSGTPCVDQYGNPVSQPLPLSGTSFAANHAIMWVGVSPIMPSGGSCGAAIPVNNTYGINTNAKFFARGGYATDNVQFNSFQSLSGGMFVGLGYTANQGIYLQAHASTFGLNTPSAVGYPSGPGYGALAYKGGSQYWYYNSTTAAWTAFDFSTGGGGGGSGCIVSGPGNAIQFNNGTGGCGGTNNAQVDADGNLSLGGSGSVLAVNGTTGGVNVTASTAYNSIQTVGGFSAAMGSAATVGITVLGHSGQTANLQEWYSSGPTLVAAIDPSGNATLAGLKFPTFTTPGCLQNDGSGIVSSTGVTCGAGGGGSPGAPDRSIQFNSSGVFAGSANLRWLVSTGVRQLNVIALDAAHAGVTVTDGFLQADGGLLITAATCLSFQCVQTQGGGFLGKNINLTQYAAMANVTAPTQTAGDSWASAPGVFFFTTAGSVPGFRFQVGTGSSTLADTNLFASGLAATGAVFNAIHADLGGISAGLGFTAGSGTTQAIGFYMNGSTTAPPTLSAPYGGLGYKTASQYYYWNGSAWAVVDLSSTGGSVPGTFGQILSANGTGGYQTSTNLTYNAGLNTLAVAGGGQFNMVGSSYGIVINAISFPSIQGVNAANTAVTALSLDPSGGPVYINKTSDDGSGAALQLTGFINAIGGFSSSTGGLFNTFQAPVGGMYAGIGFTSDQGFYAKSFPTTAPTRSPSSGYGALAYKTGTQYWYWNGTSYGVVDLSTAGGGGVTSINTTAVGAVTISGTSNRVTTSTAGSVITLSLPQDINTISTPTFAGVISPGAFNSTATGGTIAFQAGGGAFQVNGAGALSTGGVITSSAGVNVISTSSTTSLQTSGWVNSTLGYRVAGNQVINGSGVLSNPFGVDVSAGVGATGFNIHGGNAGITGTTCSRFEGGICTAP